NSQNFDITASIFGGGWWGWQPNSRKPYHSHSKSSDLRIPLKQASIYVSVPPAKLFRGRERINDLQLL
ncbi:hypothetical protein Tsubulata_041000, partial [Turnera subulata]